jgi:hypothetical protein
MDQSTRDDFLWLLSKKATEILEQTQDAFLERVNAVRIAKNLRSKTTITRAALVMEQAQLRIRGRVKFENADRMFFTRRGLEQSSGEDLANYKARRFSGVDRVADICCGIGGDLVSLIHRPGATKTVGVDSDSLTCLFAKYNSKLAAASAPEHKVGIRLKTFSDYRLKSYGGIHCDPDRRMTERTIKGDRFSPTLDDIFEKVKSAQSLAIKVAPATTLTQTQTDSVEREWIGDRRECKQQVLWRGAVANRPGNRTATCVGSDGSVHQVSVPEIDVDQTIEVQKKIREYVYEPHPTVLAAGLTDALASKYSIGRFSPGIAYLTGHHRVSNPLLTRFEVVELLRMDLRTAVSFFRKYDVGEVEVKKRGIENVVYNKFKRMKLKGPNRATLFLTRVGNKRAAIVARRNPDDFSIEERERA